MTHSLSGNLDRLAVPLVEGWAVDPECDDGCGHVDVIVDGVLIASLRANLYRGDLEHAGVRAGYAKFSFQLPKQLADGRPHTIDVRHSGTNQSVENSPATFKFGKDAATRAEEKRRWSLSSLVLQTDLDQPVFAAAVKRRRKVALMSTFHNLRRFMLYHEAAFASLVDAGFVVVVVHATANAGRGASVTIGRRNCFLISKTNVGYDFGSWAIGVFSLGQMLTGLDEVLLINDSVIETCPGGIGEMIQRARACRKDIVGLTDSYERTYHLQSYFLWFGRKACRSNALQDFMAGYSFSSDKETVIEEGELTLTARMLMEGFSIGCVHPYEQVARAWMNEIDTVIEEIRGLPDFSAKHIAQGGAHGYKERLCARAADIFALVLNGTPVNPTHFFWDTLIADGFRLVKRELITVNPVGVPTLFRLGHVLGAIPETEAAILDLRRRYGGDLVPIFWRPGEAKQPRANVVPEHWVDQAVTFGALGH